MRVRRGLSSLGSILGCFPAAEAWTEEMSGLRGRAARLSSADAHLCGASVHTQVIQVVFLGRDSRTFTPLVRKSSLKVHLRWDWNPAALKMELEPTIF